MKSIVPSPRGQVRAAAAASLPVLARLPDVSAPEPVPSEPPQQPETEDVATHTNNDRPPQPEKSDRPESPTPDQPGEGERPRERTRQPRVPQPRSPRPTPKQGRRDQRRPALPPAGYLVGGLVAVLLIVIVVLLIRNNGSAPDSQQSPGWPSGQDNYAGTGSPHNHEMNHGEADGMGTGSQLGQTAGGMAGMDVPNAATSDFAPQIEQAGDVPVPGVVRLNGTIDKPDLQARQPRENGVYPPR